MRDGKSDSEIAATELAERVEEGAFEGWYRLRPCGCLSPDPGPCPLDHDEIARIRQLLRAQEGQALSDKTDGESLAERVKRIAQKALARDLRERGVRGDRQMELEEDEG